MGKSTIITFLIVGSLLGFSVSANLPPQTKAGCSINLETSSPKYPPHLIDDKNQVILPVLESPKTRFIYLDAAQKVTVACVGKSTNFLNITGLQMNPATCIADSFLLLDGQQNPMSYDQLGCKSQNKEVLIEDGPCAEGPGTAINVGWQAGDNFILLYKMCHDKKLALNYFSTNYIVGASADADDKGNTRPSFSQGGYYPGLNVDQLYRQDQQTLTIAGIVGSDSLAAYYVNISKSFYLARGHMAPDGDFIDAASQDASYYFMNVAPQWQSFNNGNWKALETATRNLAINRRIDLDIYTGTFGVITLADVNGVQQPIYLTTDENNNGLIPAPKYYWKLVHNKATNTATAVLGINNPHNAVGPDDVICPDVCAQVPWVTWKLDDIGKGFTFCCTAAELRKAINFAPDLDGPLLL